MRLSPSLIRTLSLRFVSSFLEQICNSGLQLNLGWARSRNSWGKSELHIYSRHSSPAFLSPNHNIKADDGRQMGAKFKTVSTFYPLQCRTSSLREVTHVLERTSNMD